MGNQINLKGIAAFEGQYDLDFDRALNGQEWAWVKDISGYLPYTVDAGFAGGDPSLVIALAVVAMSRTGKIPPEHALEAAKQLAQLPFDEDHISFVGDDDPPAVSQKTSDQLESANGSSGSSGDDSRTTSENQEGTRPGIGLLASATSATSGPETSES